MDPIWLESYPEEVNHPIDFPKDQTVHKLLESACFRHQHKIAFSSQGVDLTFSQYERLASSFAAHLIDKAKIEPGDRIAIMLPNILQFPICFFGILKAGGICVNINPNYTPHEIQSVLQDSQAKILITEDQHLKKIWGIVHKTSLKSLILTAQEDQFSSLLNLASFSSIKRMVNRNQFRGKIEKVRLKGILQKATGQKTVFPEISDSTVAVLQYTGGTTGIPKGAMLSHQNLVANVRQIQEWAESAYLESNETVLTALPLYHIFSLTVNFLAFITMGGRLILVARPRSIPEVVETFKSYPISVMTGVNQFYRELSRDSEFANRVHFKLKFALAGAGPLSTKVNEQFQQITGVHILEGFGLTEASPVTHCCPMGGPIMNGSCGLPLPMTEVRVVDEEDSDVPLGEPGELLIRGPQVMTGYWNQSEETQHAIKNGWLYTGDIATVNEQGYFYIVGRKKDMIIVSGFNVYPIEIEKVLKKHPDVTDAAVVGKKKDDGSEEVWAYLVAADGVNENHMMRHCEQHLTGYKRPQHYRFRKTLPRTIVGKLKRRELREESTVKE